LDDHAVADDLEHLALLAAVSAALLGGAGDDLNQVTLLDLRHELQHLRGERDDLHELAVTKLTADRAEDAGAAGLPVVLQDDGGVLVELDVRVVVAARLLHGADDDRLDDVALLDVAARDRVLGRRDDGVAQTGVTAVGSTEHANRVQLLRAGVVGDLEAGFVLNHWLLLHASPGAYLAFSTISTRRQRLVALSGRVSLITTRSPTPAVFCSSWAFSFFVRRRTLP